MGNLSRQRIKFFDCNLLRTGTSNEKILDFLENLFSSEEGIILKRSDIKWWLNNLRQVFVETIDLFQKSKLLRNFRKHIFAAISWLFVCDEFFFCLLPISNHILCVFRHFSMRRLNEIYKYFDFIHFTSKSNELNRQECAWNFTRKENICQFSFLKAENKLRHVMFESYRIHIWMTHLKSQHINEVTTEGKNFLSRHGTRSNNFLEVRRQTVLFFFCWKLNENFEC